jgi:hypothetical protein
MQTSYAARTPPRRAAKNWAVPALSVSVMRSARRVLPISSATNSAAAEILCNSQETTSLGLGCVETYAIGPNLPEEFISTFAKFITGL